MGNYERLSEGLRIYRDAMRPFIARRLRQSYPQGNWFADHVLTTVAPVQADSLKRDLEREQKAGNIGKGKQGPESVVDITHFPSVVAGNWEAFSSGLKNRKIITLMREIADERNAWAHPPLGDLEASDVDRILDTCARVLDFVDSNAASKVKALRDSKDAPAAEPTKPEPPTVDEVPAPAKKASSKLQSWRDVMPPHPDVQRGEYVKAEFAAHLGDVHKGKAAAEYGDAKEFFGRTFVTTGTRQLLVGVVKRLRGQVADPVIDLKTAFGGGKTHTMLAAYHLVKSAKELKDDRDVQGILAEAGGPAPKTAIAVLVGTDLDPIAPKRVMAEAGDVEVNTLWGEMAYQLAKFPGYKIVQEHDAKGIAPGADVLEKLFELAGPSLILIDELVAYLRNVPERARADIPGGTYGAHMTFCQNLTEAAKKTPNVVILASIPATKIEYGDARGSEIAGQIANVFQRVGATWEPVGPREAFEVVRRRLFGDIRDDAARQETCEEFFKTYRSSAGDFPSESREPAYLERMKGSYPIHPEIFDRLYLDWAGNIDRFQRTRGVLRLMADAIHRLWTAKDPDPMILPGSLPLYDTNVRQQFIGYLDEQWSGPFDADIDHDQCEAATIEKGNQRFGRLQVCRRLTRTIFLGSVPGKAHQGLEKGRVMLGVVQPGEGVDVYGDALGTLLGRLSYLYGTDNHYWFEVRPNLNKVATDRKARVTDDDALDEIRNRLRDMRDAATAFTNVHRAPKEPSDVPDEWAARLVILGPESVHKDKEPQTKAIEAATAILDSRGNSPRVYKNMLVFLAPDAETTASMLEEAKWYVAWASIASDGKLGALNLDKMQQVQAEKSRDDASTTVTARLYEAYRWLLQPKQQGTEPMSWDIKSVTNGGLGSVGSLPQRVVNRLESDGELIRQWAPIHLKAELDKWIWKDGQPHVSLKQVWAYMAIYLYFPRLTESKVLVEAVKAGLRTKDYFGYADGVEGERYLGLVFGEAPQMVVMDDTSVLVRREVAAKQKEQETPEIPTEGGGGEGGEEEGGGPEEPPKRTVQRRFYGRARLKPARLASGAGQIGDEIVQHLNALVGAEVEVIIEVHANVPDGIPENVARTVGENARALKFDEFAFEEE